MEQEKPKIEFEKEAYEIKQRYSRREKLGNLLYSPLAPHTYMIQQEKERAIIRWINEYKIFPLKERKLLEIGCGTGSNLLSLINLGFEPENLIGNELLTDRVLKAKKNLPSGVRIIEGNALNINIPGESQDIVFQSMVFSSILDKDFQMELAKKMWLWVKPGGGILWYDFIYNNPRNKDVTGIPFSRVQALFNEGTFNKWKITLAPPLSRVITRIHPSLYSLFNLFPLLRTHILCWILK